MTEGKPRPEDRLVIALTGGIATGKSFVARILEELGAQIVDTDVIARQVVAPGSYCLPKITEIWGDWVINEDGTLDRKAMASIIFSSPGDRKALSRILHPEIIKEMESQVARSEKRVVVVVIPLLYETEEPVDFNEAWLVYCPPEVQAQRLIQRDGLTREEAAKRIDSQLPIDVKVSLSHVVIDNSGSREETRANVVVEWEKLNARPALMPNPGTPASG